MGNKSYSYRDIQGVSKIEKLKAPNGDIVNDLHYSITFNDGNEWNSRDQGLRNITDDLKLINFALKKMDLVLAELEFEGK